MSKTLGVYIQDDTQKEITLRGENRSYIINRDLGRLYALYRRALKEVELTDEELRLIVDVLNGSAMDARSAGMLWASIEDACNLDGVDSKWEVDGKALVKKLEGLSPLQCLAIVDAAERFWADEDRDLEEVRKYFF